MSEMTCCCSEHRRRVFCGYGPSSDVYVVYDGHRYVVYVSGYRDVEIRFPSEDDSDAEAAGYWRVWRDFALRHAGHPVYLFHNEAQQRIAVICECPIESEAAGRSYSCPDPVSVLETLAWLRRCGILVPDQAFERVGAVLAEQSQGCDAAPCIVWTAETQDDHADDAAT